MRYFLSEQCRRVAVRLAAEKTLCAFDYDGTLAPIVAHPASARMRAGTSRLLARVAALYPCAVISGRARRDLHERLAGTGVKRVIGNHGAEAESHADAGRPEVERWLTALAPAIAPLVGVWVENKGYSLAVHYRQSAHKGAARQRILTAARRLKHVRVVGGKQVINLLPAGAPNKGTALVMERDRLGCDWVLYIGDDENDEDAFCLDVNIVAVRVGRKARSCAGYYLREQAEIDRLLKLLVVLREGTAGRGLPRGVRSVIAARPESDAVGEKRRRRASAPPAKG